MSEHKAFASLSSGLLARKGSARPAMRRQGFGQVSAAGLDDLGWNDMGDPDYPVDDAPEGHEDGGEVAQFKANPLAALSPATSPVHDQRDEIERAFGYTEDEEHHDGDDIYDETAEPWDEEDEGSPIDLGIGGFDREQSFDEEPKLKRTVADLLPMTDVPAADEGTTNPLSDFSHLPTDFSAFGKPAAPEAETPRFESEQEEPVAEEIAPQATAFAPQGDAMQPPVDDTPDAEIAEDEQELAEDNRFQLPSWALESADLEDETAEEDEQPVAEDDSEEEMLEAPQPGAAASLVDTLNAFERDAADEDSGEQVEEASAAPVESEPVAEQSAAEPVVDEQPAETVVDIADVEPIAARTDGAREKAAFTLRLDKDRHLKLRLACAISGVSAQKFVTEALDRALAEMPELDKLADDAPEARKRA